MPGIYNRQSTGGSVAIKDEGITITSSGSSLDFVGGGVSASAAGSAATINIAGSGGGALATEAPPETVNGSTTVFTFTNQPAYVIADNQTYFLNKGYTQSGSGPYTITMDVAPWNYIRSVY